MWTLAALLLALIAPTQGAISTPALKGVLRRVGPLLRDNWIFYYADTKPFEPETPEGVAFLATNVGFAVTGVAFSGSDPALGALVEVRAYSRLISSCDAQSF